MVSSQSTEEWRNRRKVKTVTVLTAGWIAAASLLIWQVGTLSPWLSVTVFGALTTIVLATGFDRVSLRSEFNWYLALVVVVGVFYRLLPILFTSSPIGVDPNWYEVQIRSVIDVGRINAIDNPFYQSAPIFILGVTIAADITGLSIENVMVVLPISLGVVLPLTSTIISLELTDDRFAGLLAASVVALSPPIVRFSFSPVAQSYGLLLFAVFILMVFNYHSILGDNPRHQTVIILLIATAMGFTHKLPLLVGTLLLVSITVITWLNLIDREHSQSTLFLICTIILLFVWAFATNFFFTLTLRLRALLAVGFDPYTTFIEPNAATRTKDELRYVIGRNLDWITLTITGGIGWLCLAKQLFFGNKPDQRTLIVVVLLTTALMMVLLGIGTVGSAAALNPTRIIVLAVFLLASLTAVLFVEAFDQHQRRHIVVVAAVIILATQAFTLGALPDDENAARSYLTASENHGKQFIANYTTGPIYTDTYYVRGGPDISDPITGYWSTTDGKFRSYDTALFNGDLDSVSPRYVAYRTDVDIYGHTSFGGYWVLEWNPRNELDTCGNQIYSIDDVVLYDASECWSS